MCRYGSLIKINPSVAYLPILLSTEKLFLLLPYHECIVNVKGGVVGVEGIMFIILQNAFFACKAYIFIHEHVQPIPKQKSILKNKNTFGFPCTWFYFNMLH